MQGKTVRVFVIAVAAALLSLAGAGADTPAGVPRVRVVVHAVDGDYRQHEAFAREAAQKLEEVINSAAFAQRVRAGGYTRTLDRTPADVLASILRAHEETQAGGTDGVVDLRLRTIVAADDQVWARRCQPGSNAGTLGIDDNGSGFLATCPQRLAQWAADGDLAMLAGHMMHEYMHMLGYDHDVRGRRRRERTAVYVIGDLVWELLGGDR